MTGPADVPALAAERTGLAWERSALAALVGGGLLMLQQADGGVPVLVAASTGLLLALGLALLGARRARVLRGPTPDRVARRAVLAAGLASAGFGLVVLLALAVTGP